MNEKIMNKKEKSIISLIKHENTQNDREET